MTFDNPSQALEFAQAKVEGLVAYCAESNEEGKIGQLLYILVLLIKCTHTIIVFIVMFDSLLVLFFVDPETLKFRDVERRFVKQFQMPQEEKLVNCNSGYFVLFYYSFLFSLFCSRLCL